MLKQYSIRMVLQCSGYIIVNACSTLKSECHPKREADILVTGTTKCVYIEYLYREIVRQTRRLVQKRVFMYEIQQQRLVPSCIHIIPDTTPETPVGSNYSELSSLDVQLLLTICNKFLV